MGKTFSVHQPQYLPWLGYFDKIAKSDCFVFLDTVQYKPREFQNRNKIRTKDGSLWLSVPVICKGKRRQSINDAMVDNEMPWQRQHLRSLKTWYARSEFFDEHIPFFEETYVKKWDRLVDLNMHIIEYCVLKLGIKTPRSLESQLHTETMSTDRIMEIAKKLGATTYLSGLGGKDYLDEAKFAAAGVKLVYQDFVHPVYRQQFAARESDFIPYMSIADLLFNEGPRCARILKIKEA